MKTSPSARCVRHPDGRSIGAGDGAQPCWPPSASHWAACCALYELGSGGRNVRGIQCPVLVRRCARPSAFHDTIDAGRRVLGHHQGRRHLSSAVLAATTDELALGAAADQLDVFFNLSASGAAEPRMSQHGLDGDSPTGGAAKRRLTRDRGWLSRGRAAPHTVRHAGTVRVLPQPRKTSGRTDDEPTGGRCAADPACGRVGAGRICGCIRDRFRQARCLYDWAPFALTTRISVPSTG